MSPTLACTARAPAGGSALSESTIVAAWLSLHVKSALPGSSLAIAPPADSRRQAMVAAARPLISVC